MVQNQGTFSHQPGNVMQQPDIRRITFATAQPKTMQVTTWLQQQIFKHYINW